MISKSIKDELTKTFLTLDPFGFIGQLKNLQADLKTLAWNIKGSGIQSPVPEVVVDKAPVMIKPKETGALTYFHFEKPRDKSSFLGTWRTRKDPFEHAWDEIKFNIQLEPHYVAKDIIERLSERYPSQYCMGQVRTLQRRLSTLRLRYQTYQAKLTQLMQT